MASVTHQPQGSCATFPLRPVSWNRGIGSKQCVKTVHIIGGTDRLLKCKSCLCVRAPLKLGPKVKSLKISSFKGIGQNDSSGGRVSESKSLKSSGKRSYVPHESADIVAEFPKVQNVPVSEADETTSGSKAIQNLFKNWLTLMRTSSPDQVVDETLDQPSSVQISETQNKVPNNERGESSKVVWRYFLGVDATIKIPLMIFIPMYLAANIIYGAEVSKELTPLWVLGPLIVALYIKMLRGICALYVFSFKQTVKVVKNLPAYYLVAFQYIFGGRLKEHMLAYVWQPVVDFKNLDYNDISRRKMKDFQAWLMEKYLDYVESVWPYYCRTIRFLKRANLI